MNAALGVAAAVGVFWLLVAAIKHWTHTFIAVGVVLDGLVMVALAAFAVYGMAKGYSQGPWDHHGLSTQWAMAHQIVLVFVGPLLTIANVLAILVYVAKQNPVERTDAILSRYGASR